MFNLKNLFAGPPDEPIEIPVEPEPILRTSIDVAAELQVAQDATSKLAERLSTAQEELAKAQESYDSGIRAFAIGVSSEPDRGDLQAAINKTDVLRRVRAEQERTLARLTSELPQVQLQEAVKAGRDRMPLLIGAAEAKLDEFCDALTRLKILERDLFENLFNETRGLKQRFPSDELTREAAKNRRRISDQTEETSKHLGYWRSLDPRFETDGNVNLGREEAEQGGFTQLRAYSNAAKLADLRRRASDAMAEFFQVDYST